MAKKSVGRPPTKLTQEQRDTITKYAKDGFTITEICRIAKIKNRATFYAMMERDPELADLVYEGRMEKIHSLRVTLEGIAMGKLKGNPVAAIFLLKTLGHGEDRAQTLAQDEEKHAQVITSNEQTIDEELAVIDQASLDAIAAVLDNVIAQPKAGSADCQKTPGTKKSR